MLFGFWSWVLVILIVAAIFYANKLPQLRQQAEQKLKEGKILLERSKKELESKANVLAEKAKEKQNTIKATKAKKEVKIPDEEKEITIEDLAFMPTKDKDEAKKSDKK